MCVGEGGKMDSFLLLAPSTLARHLVYHLQRCTREKVLFLPVIPVLMREAHVTFSFVWGKKRGQKPACGRKWCAEISVELVAETQVTALTWHQADIYSQVGTSRYGIIDKIETPYKSRFFDHLFENYLIT